MSAPESKAESQLRVQGQPYFVTTCWSVVLRAGGVETVQANAALQKLAEIYWYPLYAYVRRRGYSPHEAQDLTQDFFAHVIEKNSFGVADRNRGRFRSFLLTVMNHLLANDWQRRNALKRGGSQRVVSFDAMTAEERYMSEPATELSPEKLFDRKWAQTILDRSLGRLADEWKAAGKGGLFSELKRFVTEEPVPGTYAEISGRLGITQEAIRQMARRLRLRYRELLREDIAETVSTWTDIDDELKHLRAAFSPD